MANKLTNGTTKGRSALEAFNIDQDTGANVRFSDLTTDQDVVAPVGNNASNANLAAHATVLQGLQGDIISTYKQILDESSLVGKSQTATKLIDQSKASSQQENIGAVTSLLTDPVVSDIVKKAAITKVTDKNSTLYDMSNMLSNKAIDAPTEHTNPEIEKHRINIGSISATMNADKQNRQKALSSVMIGRDPNLLDKVGNLLSSFVPGVAEARQANIASQFDKSLGGKQSTIDKVLDYVGNSNLIPGNILPGNQTYSMSYFKNLLMGIGSSRQAIQRKLAALPPDKQAAAMQSLSEIISNNPSPLSGLPNYAANREDLQNAIANGGYGSKEAFADNATSVMDLAGILPVGEAAGVLKGARKFVKTAKTADKIAESASEVSKYKTSAQFEEDLNQQVAAWKAAEPAPVSNVEADLAKQVDEFSNKPNARRSKEELDQAAAIKDWKKSKPTADSVEADYARQVKNFSRRKGPKPSALENDIAAEIEAFHAKQVESNITVDSVKSEVQPTTVSQNYKDTNPDALRASFDTVASGQTDAAAEALYGTSRGDALSNDLLPEVGHSDGSVNAKVSFPDAISHVAESIPPEVAYFVAKGEGVSYMTRAEIANTTSWKINQVADAIQMSERPEMFQVHSLGENVKETSRGFKISGVYGPQEMGYSDPQAAMDLAKFSLRSTGIPDKDIILLKRLNGEYVTTDLASEAGEKNGDYLIQIDHEYVATPNDFVEANAAGNLDVKNNFLDRRRLTDGSQGSAASMLLSRGSMISPIIYKSALAISDSSKFLEKSLLKTVEAFAKPFKALPIERQRLLEQEIVEANRASRAYDYPTLKASGMSDHEIRILDKFKKANDTQWFLENNVLAKNLDARGYEEFLHGPSGTREPVKPIKVAGNVPKNVLVMDHTTGGFKQLGKDEVDNIYQNGGKIGNMLHPHTTPGGDVVEHVIIDNTNGGSYTRKIIPGQTSVLSYRPGYFKVHYNDPHIIVKRTIDPTSGKVISEGAVATAETQNEANLYIDNMKKVDPDNEYFRRNSREHGEDPVKDEYSMAVSSGRSAWKRRGLRLEDADSNIVNITDNHIGNPIEGLVRNARSLSNKTSYSDMIATSIERVKKQYGDLLPSENGQVLIPNDSRDIKYRGVGTEDRSRIADARTTIDYINYLRTTGYVNLLDKATQGSFRELADLMGAKGFARSEKFLNGFSNVSIPRTLKSTAYHLYLATSPLRQFVVQSSQMAMLAAINPSWMASKMLPQIFYFGLRQVGMDAAHPIAKMLAKGFGSEEHLADDIWKSFQSAGISSAIDSTNLVGGVVADAAKRMVDSTHALKLPVRAAKSVSHGLRVVGFDAGEWASSTGSWLAHRDLAKQLGRDVFDVRELENIAGHARNYTGSMNHAGDMPQNQNALSLLAQFTQMTQKMGENLISNRVIDKTAEDSLYASVKGNVKVRQAALLIAMFGLPSAAVWNKYTSAALDKTLPDNPADPGHIKLRKSLDQGLEGWSLNYILSKTFDQKVDLDFAGSLNPFNANGTAQLMYNLWTSSPGTILGKTPAGSLLFGANPKIGDFVKTVSRFANLIDDYDDPTTFSEVAKSAANMFSGASSYFKMQYALEYSKKMSASGRVTDDAVSPVEAYGALFGVGTEDEKRKFSVTSAIFDNKTKKEDDFNMWYKEASKHFKTKYENINEFDLYVKTLSEFHRVYGDNPEYKTWLDKKLRQEVGNGNNQVFTMFLRNSSLYGEKNIDALIDEYPFQDQSTRDALKAEIKALELKDNTEK